MEAKTKARDGGERFPGIYRILICTSRSRDPLNDRETKYLGERGPETDHLENPEQETSGRVPDHIPIRGYTSKREVQEKALNRLSDGTLIATLYGVKMDVHDHVGGGKDVRAMGKCVNFTMK